VSADPLMALIEQLEHDWDRYLEAEAETKEEVGAHLDYLATQQNFWQEVQPVGNSEKAKIVEYLEEGEYDDLKNYVRRELR